MSELQSKIILAKNIKMDKDYNNVVDYNENQIIELMQNSSHYVNSADNYQFLRPQNSIFVNFTYEECLRSNYIAFQNKDYSNKWFFAWIDEVIYQSESSCEIKYTIDAWSTWYQYWNAKTCFVAREHANDDTVGKHTIPENLNIGQIICDNEKTENIIGANSFYWLVIACNFNPSDETRYAGIGKYGNYPQGSMWFAWLINNDELSTGADIDKVTDWIFDITKDGHAGDIQSIFALPYQAFSVSDIDEETHMVKNGGGKMLNEELVYSKSEMRKFNDYTPKNNKLLTYPYSYIRVTNNAGSFNDYKIEDFHVTDVEDNETDEIKFNAIGVPCQGYSGKLRPVQYQGIYHNEDESIQLGKYPTLSWTSDGFTNWLTQNGVNMAIGTFGGVAGGMLGIATGLVSANPIAVAGGIMSASMSVANSIGGMVQATMLPNTAQGNANAGDLSFVHNINRFKIMHMRPKKENLQIIDDYFTRFGYATNRVKVPNIKGRSIFNYVEIGNTDTIGNGEVPAKYMSIINNACRKGVTIWHNHENVGNYGLDNQITG